MTCTIDKWYNLTMQDIRRLEDENMKELEEKIKSKEVAVAYIVFALFYRIDLLRE